MGPSRSLPILAIFVLLVWADDSGAVWKGFSVSCNHEEAANVSVSCHGIRLVRRIVQKLLEDASRKQTLELLDGVSLVEREDGGANSMGARQLNGVGQMDRFMRFLESRELRIKLPILLPNNLESAIKESLPPMDQGRGHGGGGGFGGGKKGDGGVMLMALMMGKMMAAMGFGALGLLAMKALMVSSLALMLSLIVAAKKLASGKDDDSHHVVYAQEVAHHRRRRSLDNLQDNIFNQPYRGYMHLSHSILKS